MARMRKIGIDVDVHRSLEQRRVSFSQTENDILRTILLPHLSETEEVGEAPTAREAPLPGLTTISRKRGLWTVVIAGPREPAGSLTEAYRLLLLLLHDRNPQFLQKFSLEKARTRRFVARTPSSLYATSPHLARDYAKPLVDGWFYDTNLSTQQVSARAHIAARLCGMHYGREFCILDNLKEI